MIVWILILLKCNGGLLSLSITQKLELLEKNIDYGKIDYLREKVKIFLNYKPPNYITFSLHNKWYILSEKILDKTPSE